MYLDINQAAISNMDLKRLKSVKVMVEKLDIHSSLVKCFKSNKIFNRVKTLNNELDEHLIECSSSNVKKSSIDVKRKFSNSTDVDEHNNLQESDTKNQSPNDLLITKRLKYKFRS